MATTLRFPRKAKALVTIALAACSLSMLATARAEMSEIHVSRQYGISYLPLMIMEDQKLIEKHAKAEGIDVKVDWSKFASGAVMNDALLSGNLQFASGGVAPFTTLWAKTRGNLDVKGVAAINSMPLYLVTNNPNVKTIKDFTEKDKIALPAVKVSIQAVTLQMAAEKAFGPGQQNKLDHLTVSMSHPDAETALLSGGSEITAHLGSPPFQYQELEHKGMHRVLNSYDVLGGPATFNVVWTTKKFHDDNPKVNEAVVAAMDEADKLIKADPKRAAEIYLAVTKEKTSVDDLVAMITNPKVAYRLNPSATYPVAQFLHKIGRVKHQASSWKDLFFPSAYDRPGS